MPGGKIPEEKLKAGGRLAFVLPATALTGSRWDPIRELLLNNYDIEWVVVSHDERYRPPRQGLPGRVLLGSEWANRLLASGISFPSPLAIPDRSSPSRVRFAAPSVRP